MIGRFKLDRMNYGVQRSESSSYWRSLNEGFSRRHLDDLLFTTPFTLSGFGRSPCPSITCHNNLTESDAKTYFPMFKVRPVVARASKTIPSSLLCSARVNPNKRTLSRCTRQEFHLMPDNARSMSLWYVAGALFRPKSIRRKLNKPSYVQ